MWDEGSELGVVGKGLNWDLIQAPCPQGGSMDSLSPSKWKLLWKEGKFPGAAEVLPVFGGEGGAVSTSESVGRTPYPGKFQIYIFPVHSLENHNTGKNSSSGKTLDLGFPCLFPGESTGKNPLSWKTPGFTFSCSFPGESTMKTPHPGKFLV